MSTPSKTQLSFGFSLVEVVIALGIVALAIPAIIGVLAVASSSSSSTIDRGEVASAADALRLYLNGKVKDPVTSASVPFATVYGWVYASRQSPASAQVIYAYKTNANQTDYIFSQTPPAGVFVGKMLAAEIRAPETNVLPSNLLPGDAAQYSKSYLSLKASIYALSATTQQVSPATFVDSYPMTISR